MAIPGKINGAGNVNRKNVIKITFSEGLSNPMALEAWDNIQTFPAVETDGSTIDKEIFIGTTGNSNKPMMYAIITTDAKPGNNWKPTTVIAGGATPNRLKGQTNYLQGTVITNADEHVLINLGVEVPYDASVNTNDYDSMIQIRYTYTGDEPNVTFHVNQGTENVPVWTEITPGTHGLRFANNNTNWTSGPYRLTIPITGTIDAPEFGVTN